MRFAFRRDVALGRYVPLDTSVHRLDPRTKTFLFAVALVLLFRAGPFGAAAVVAALFGALAVARIPLRRAVGALRALAWILVVTFLFQWLWVGPRQLGGFGPGAVSGVTMAIRLAGMLLAATLLSATTEPIRLADGLGRLFAFLERVRVPVRDLALVLTLALRFLPTVMEEAERLAGAQRARGARFEGGVLTRARRMLPLAVPLFAGCLRRADVLALAMEARGFRSSGAPRTSWEPLAFARADVWTLAGGSVILGASLLGAPGDLMGSWKLVVEYDGTDFAGWQVQPTERTVQGELKSALETVLRHPVRVTGAGRTDAGVHALGQVVSFESDEDVAAARHSVNGVLPRDVVVREAVPAPDGFHARFDAVRRHYRYRLFRGVTAVHRRTTWMVKAPLDVAGMRKAAALVPGTRDFTSLASELAEGETTDCTVERVDVLEDGPFVDVEVTANRFLRRMVRTMTGTLLEVGLGRQPVAWITKVLEARDRRLAGPVIPPTGLFLVAVDYPDDVPEGGNR